MCLRIKAIILYFHATSFIYEGGLLSFDST